MNEVIRTELLPETQLCGGKYVIEKIIGAGGFGITYLAKHATLEKKYAIKEFFLSGYNVRNSVTNSVSLQGIEEKDFDKFRQRFIDEARTLASLNNDAVVKVVDIFDENGTSYMVMPFVEGITLQSMVDENGPMDYEMAVNYIVRICDALSYIHSKNILHRDVTPDNIIVTPEQKTVLIDFGSARKFVNNKTQRHTTILKQGYAPLEQYSATSRKGAYTDLYSLGGVFYFILTGVRPLDATERTMEKMKEPIELNPKIPEQINAVIMKAMEMDSSDRYQSAAELEEDILSGNTPKKKESSTTPAVEESPIAIPQGNKKEHKKNYRLVVLAVIILALGIFFLTQRTRTELNSENNSYVTDAVQREDGVAISLDSLLFENEEATFQRLKDNPRDPAALYSLAYNVSTCRYNKYIEQYWEEEIVPEYNLKSFITTDRNSKSSNINNFTPYSLAFVCAALAYSNINNSSYTKSVKKELEDSITNILDRLKEEGIDSDFNYEKQ